MTKHNPLLPKMTIVIGICVFFNPSIVVYISSFLFDYNSECKQQQLQILNAYKERKVLNYLFNLAQIFHLARNETTKDACVSYVSLFSAEIDSNQMTIIFLAFLFFFQFYV
jgi:nitrate reductase assembly molybdenum cofactor insertion protein NarJ